MAIEYHPRSVPGNVDAPWTWQGRPLINHRRVALRRLCHALGVEAGPDDTSSAMVWSLVDVLRSLDVPPGPVEAALAGAGQGVGGTPSAARA